jgi:hypothetical protein
MLHYGPVADSAPNTNEHQGSLLGDKAGCSLGRNTQHFRLLIFLKFWEPQTPGNIGASPDLYKDGFTFACFANIIFVSLVCQGIQFN